MHQHPLAQLSPSPDAPPTRPSPMASVIVEAPGEVPRAAAIVPLVPPALAPVAGTLTPPRAPGGPLPILDLGHSTINDISAAVGLFLVYEGNRPDTQWPDWWRLGDKGTRYIPQSYSTDLTILRHLLEKQDLVNMSWDDGPRKWVVTVWKKDEPHVYAHVNPAEAACVALLMASGKVEVREASSISI